VRWVGSPFRAGGRLLEPGPRAQPLAPASPSLPFSPPRAGCCRRPWPPVSEPGLFPHRLSHPSSRTSSPINRTRLLQGERTPGTRHRPSTRALSTTRPPSALFFIASPISDRLHAPPAAPSLRSIDQTITAGICRRHRQTLELGFQPSTSSKPVFARQNHVDPFQRAADAGFQATAD